MTVGRFQFCALLLGALVLVGCGMASERLIRFEKDNRWGYADTAGNVVIAPRYFVAHDFTPEGLAAVADETDWAYIDRRGTVVVRPFVFDNSADEFRDGLARFVVDGKFGFFDTSGRVVVEPAFDFAGPFSEGLAPVCRGCRMDAEGEHTTMVGGRWGYIDTAGDAVIAPRFSRAGRFENGTAEVAIDGVAATIDRTGTPVK